MDEDTHQAHVVMCAAATFPIAPASVTAAIELAIEDQKQAA
jgi:hypothetical protein